MMKKQWLICGALTCATMMLGQSAMAAVTAEDAAKLKTALTPMGAEKAGNKDGTIPAWTGGYTTAVPGFKNGGRRAATRFQVKSRCTRSRPRTSSSTPTS